MGTNDCINFHISWRKLAELQAKFSLDHMPKDNSKKAHEDYRRKVHLYTPTLFRLN